VTFYVTPITATCNNISLNLHNGDDDDDDEEEVVAVNHILLNKRQS